MCLNFHANKLACLKGCYDQLCQMLRTDQAVLIKIHVISQDLRPRISFAVLRSNVLLCTLVRQVCGLRGAEKIVMILVIYKLLENNFQKKFEMNDKFDTGL